MTLRARSLQLAAIRLVILLAVLLSGSSLLAINDKKDSSNPCPRPNAGSTLEDAHERVSKNGLLDVTLTVHSSVDENGNRRYCYTDEDGYQAPTLRVQPGDLLLLHLKNRIQAKAPPKTHSHDSASDKRGDCSGSEMDDSTTNLHFHGLAIPPLCHQDETLKTLIQPGDPPFEYRVRIPRTQPPGLYWYHPHVHGVSEQQLLGGASGAIIVEGTSTTVPEVSGLPERVLVIRDAKMPDINAAQPDPNRPTKQLSINYIPVPYPDYPGVVIKMKPLERQLWRVLNASADTYINLVIEYGGKRQPVGLVSLDGVPLRYGEPGGQSYIPQKTNIFLVPAGRAEFIITAPPEGTPGRLITLGVFRGADEDGKPVAPPKNGMPAIRVGLDDVDPTRPLASIVASRDATVPKFSDNATDQRSDSAADLSGIKPVRRRLLYFSERVVTPSDPKSPTEFFITEEGHTPAVFDPSAEPNITVHQGDVEDWTIENRSREVHTFHVHQLHFLVVGRRGTGWEEPSLRDTVNVAAWSGFGPYPSITVRMDFRNPNIVGTFPFHCHIVQHLDGGMMGTVRVDPAQKSANLPADAPR